ncbi:MAG: 5-formyltetrahydrofolate cyclo-ligase [Lachnospiraceae bacterium]
MERKKAIRKLLLTGRNQITEEKREADSHAIRKALLKHPWFKQADSIYLYASYGSEVDTWVLGRNCLEQKKQLFFPKILKAGQMEFYPVASLDELKEGYGGIKEPPLSLKEERKKDWNSLLMIMPLVGFDEEGNRLGYGGGFYDRYLADKPKMRTIALAFEEQCLKEGLPVDSFDLRPQVILTPHRYLNTYGVRKGE